MANNLSVKIGANTADLEKSIERAKRTLEQYSRAAKQAKSEIENNVSVSNQQVNAYQRVVKQLEKVNSGTLSTTQQQKVLSNQVKELKIQWNAMTDDQRISGWGQQIADSLKAAESELETTKQKLESVSEQTKKTSETSESYSESSINLSGVLSKLGIAIGGAEAAQKLFTAAVQSGNDTTDLYQNTLASLTGTFDQLMYSLVHFDFTAFNDGLATTISRFYQAADAADTLWNVMASFSAVQADANEKMARAREILSDTNASQAERTKALKLYREGVDELQAGVNEATKSTMDSINKTLSTGGKEVNLTLKTLGKLLKVQSTNHGEDVRKMLKGDVEAARRLVKAGFTVTAEEAYALSQLYTKYTDEQLDDIIKKYNQIKAMQSEVSRDMRMENRLTNRATSTPRISTPRQTTPKQKPKSIKEQISWGPSEVAKSLQVMKDYEDERAKIAEDAAKKQEETNKWWNERNEKADELAAKRRLAAKKREVEESDKLTEEQIKKQEEDRKNKQQLALSTAALLSQTAQMVGQETAAGKALMAMSKMVIIAKEAEALAKGIASASGIGWPQNIPAIASIVASITSIFASLPTFADGGIFSGSSRIGDYNVARVNDGEMILNGSQQSNLFKMLNSPIANQQQSTSIASTRVRGQDIYISLKTFLKENPSKKL